MKAAGSYIIVQFLVQSLDLHVLGSYWSLFGVRAAFGS